MENRRRARFLAWFKATYPDDSSGRSKFMRDSSRYGHEPLTKGRVSQLFNEQEPFGERAARALAERFGLPSDYFEQDDPAVAAGKPPAPVNRPAIATASDPDALDSLIATSARHTTELATLLPESARVRFGLLLGDHIAGQEPGKLAPAFNRLIHRVNDGVPPPWRQPDSEVPTLARLQRFRQLAHQMSTDHPDPKLREVLTAFVLAVEAESAALLRSGVEQPQRGRQPHDN